MANPQPSQSGREVGVSSARFIPVWMSLDEAQRFLDICSEGEPDERLVDKLDDAIAEETPRTLGEMRVERRSDVLRQALEHIADEDDHVATVRYLKRFARATLERQDD